MILIAGCGLWAQLTTGSITGVVQDPSGGLVPGAQVTLTDLTKNFNYQAKTDGTGRYLFRALPPSTYELTVEAAGFAKFEQTNLGLDIAANATVNVNLKLATPGQTVEVVDTGAPLLQTQDAATGQTLNQTFIQNMPLIGRAVFDLAYLAPGVSQAPGNAFGANKSSWANNFVSEGGRNAQADILLDGVTMTNYEQNTGVVQPLYTPSVDAVQEFKIQQTNFAAEFGYSGSTIINVVTRSGTNQLHGSAYEFFRNTDLNANDYFYNATPSNAGKSVPYHWNNFGGTVGGPVKRDKVFFFFDYDGSRQVTPQSATLGLPSAAERAGNFAEVCARNGGTFGSSGMCSVAAGQIWDPYVVDPTKSNPTRLNYIPFNNLATYASPGNSKTPWIQPGVVGNLLNPVTQKILGYVPVPNLGTPGAAGYNPQGNWFGSSSRVTNPNQFDAKVDSQLTDRDMLGVRMSHSWGNTMDANLLGNVFDANTQGPNKNTVYSGALNYTHTFSPSTILTATAGYSHSWSHTLGNIANYPDFSITSLGLPANLTSSGFISAPAIQISGYGSENGNATFGGQPWSGMLYGQAVSQGIATVSHTVGRHEIKFGGEMRIHQINFTQFGLPAGKWQFQQEGTSQQYNTGGDAMASFLTGFVGGGGWSAYEIPASPATANKQYSGFVQDNWRVNDRLTVNLGLRYDVDMPRTERYDRMSYFDPSQPSPIPGVMGLFQYVGNGNPRSPYNTYFGGIGPRVGFAYRLDRKTTMRGGYGIYYDPSKMGAAGAGSGGAGFQGYDQYTTWSAYQGDNITPNLVLGQPVSITVPPGKSQGVYTALGGSLQGIPIPTYNILPRIQSWSFGFQRELPDNIVIDAGYVGTKGNHLYMGGDVYALDHLSAAVADQFRANPQAFLANASIPANIVDAVKANTPAWSNGIWGGSWQAYNAYLPYPQYPLNLWGSNGLQNVDPPIGNSIYHAFQLKVEKRFAHGLQFLFTYSAQKSIDDSSLAGTNVWVNGTAGATLANVEDPNNLRLERSLSQFDISQIAQFSFVYELPYGANRHWGANANPVVKGVLGNWQVNGGYRWDSGLPIILYTANGGTNIPYWGAQRPNLSGPLNQASGTNITQYFANPQVATMPQPYYDGTAPRVMPNLRQPGTNNLSASLLKDIPLAFREGARLQFRAESFNLFNRVQFGAPATNVGLSNFGAITSQANQPRILQLALKFYW